VRKKEDEFPVEMKQGKRKKGNLKHGIEKT